MPGQTDTAPHLAIACIGAGNMASAIVGGLVKQGIACTDITVADAIPEQCEVLAQRFGVAIAADNALAAKGADLVILAVKPDAMQTVCREIAGVLSASTCLLSVAAGTRIDSIKLWTHHKSPVIRCMPNTPALIGAGASALFASEDCSEAHRLAASTILSTVGVVCWVAKESALDAVTALSGSGPAYFFRMIECMTVAAVEMGLEPDTAETLAIETAYGAAAMARLREATPATLRANVTSKGGTTAAALASFASAGLPDIVARAMAAARTRAEELGGS